MTYAAWPKEFDLKHEVIFNNNEYNKPINNININKI